MDGLASRSPAVAQRFDEDAVTDCTAGDPTYGSATMKHSSSLALRAALALLLATICTPAFAAALIEPIPSDQPSAAQRAQIERKYGFFCHFGLNTYAGKEWTDGKVLPEVYAPPADIATKADGWVKFARDAGMRYFLCITKHHDGFCMWDSKFTEYDVGNPKVQVHTDVVKAIADACKKYDIAFAVYYSSWDRHEPSFKNSLKYTQYMKNQLTELLTNYGPVCEIWFDGAWVRDAEFWNQPEVYDHIKRLQPDCQVSLNHTVAKPKNSKPSAKPEVEKVNHSFNYFPCDFRIFDPFLPDLNDHKLYVHDGKTYYLPFEATVTVAKDNKWFGFAGDKGAKSIDELEKGFWRATANDNLLVYNIPPDQQGNLIPSQVNALMELAKRLDLGPGKPIPKAKKAEKAEKAK